MSRRPPPPSSKSGRRYTIPNPGLGIGWGFCFVGTIVAVKNKFLHSYYVKVPTRMRGFATKMGYLTCIK